MHISGTNAQGSSSFPANQTPIQVLKSNNMNLPLNTMNEQNINESKISGSQSRRRQSIFDPNQNYDKKELLTESKRPLYQQKFSNRKSRESVGSAREEEGQKPQRNWKPIIFGIIGFLALLGIIALILALVLNHPKQNNLQNEEGKIADAENAVKTEQKKEGVVIVTEIEKSLASARENIVNENAKKNNKTPTDTLQKELPNVKESVQNDELDQGAALNSGLEDPAAQNKEKKGITSAQNNVQDEETKEAEALEGVIGEEEKEAEKVVKNSGEKVNIGETSVSSN